MIFDIEKIKPYSKKIILYEFDKPVPLFNLISYEAGLFFQKITVADDIVIDSENLQGYYGNEGKNYKLIKSLKVNDLDYLLVDSVDEVRQAGRSFFYDKLTTQIYIHFIDYEYPLNKVILAGAVYGFCDKVDQEKGCYYNDLYYEPRIKNLPTIKKSKDPLFFGMMKFQSCSVSLVNNDGMFDDVKKWNLYRQASRFLVGFEGMKYDEFIQIFEGYIEKQERDFKDYKITIQDKRKALNRDIPARIFDITDYPYLKDENKNKPLQLAYGFIKNAPCVCLNETEISPTAYKFKFMDTEDHLVTSFDTAYVDGSAVAILSYDLTKGVFSLAPSVVDDKFDNVTCDFTGANISNGIDIIMDILIKYSGVIETDSFFNLEEWTEAVGLSKNVGLYINKETEIIKIIEEICSSIDAIFFVQRNGRFSARVYSGEREINRIIRSDEWIGDPKIQTNENEFLSSVKVLYGKEWKDNKYLEYLNDKYVEQVLKLFPFLLML